MDVVKWMTMMNDPNNNIRDKNKKQIRKRIHGQL